jgi:hypothetical protein
LSKRKATEERFANGILAMSQVIDRIYKNRNLLKENLLSRMNEEESACINGYAVFLKRVDASRLISKLYDCIYFYAAAKWCGYEVRMGVTQAG